MFFNEEGVAKKGYKGGSDKNLSEIDKYVRPWLLAAGYDCKKDKADNTSNKQRIYRKNKPNGNYVLTQIIVVDSLHTIDSRANTNISEELVNTTTEENRVEAQLKYLLKNKVYLLLFVKTGNWFIFVPYSFFPKEHFNLTYRGRPDRKNRMWVSPANLPMFRKVNKLESELNLLNI